MQPTWSVQKYEVFSPQRHGPGKRGQDWAKKYLKTDFFKGFMDR
ncbi:hypothetical protein FQN60_011446 [Etheostoma spectabile]|uniref:Uncharacterized protein n=1 Tax=Etheostoma spectabile TaxID=54343 RepID=A0A5J5DRW7_9PERO|nr:hypothetical protein FQN60_011446 [Etheostoma spectabile]